MLFKQIFNWIKYKTLPPSLLFKNRLFIERDSKTKRIFNNLGLTFRNSKWTSFEMSNIQSHFKSQYSRFVLLIVLAILTFLYLWKFNQLYLCTFAFNQVFFVVWSGLDLFDYCWTFIFWCGFAVFSFFNSIVQTYLFFNNFPPRKFKLDRNGSLIVDLPVNNEPSSSSKKDHKWLLFSWINNSDISAPSRLNVVKSWFDSALSGSGWVYYFNFFKRLYRIDFFLSVNKDVSTFSMIGYNTKKAKTGSGLKTVTYTTTSALTNIYSSFFLSFLVKNYAPRNGFGEMLDPSLAPFDNLSIWSLANYSCLDINYENLLKKVNGLYYIHNLNYNTLMSYCDAMLNVSQNMITAQLNSAKWDRWLYKYSLLHRKVFKNSHKLTLSKKLLNSTFYNTDLTKKNLWYSELLNKHSNSNLLHFTTNLFQFNLANRSHFALKQNKNTMIFNNTKYQDNLLMLKTYENSFFWFLKRSYLFTNLFSNDKNSTPIKNLNLNKNETFFFSNDCYFTVYSFLSNNVLLNLNLLNPTIGDLPAFINKYTGANGHDLSLVFNDLDLFEKDNLEILSSLTQLPVFFEHKSLLPYFSYYEFLALNFSNPFIFQTTTRNNYKLNNDFIFILTKNNLFQLKDILILLNIK